MDELNQLIDLCEKKSNKLKSVKYPDLLHKYLLEMRDNVIGLERTKNAIAKQTMYLITNKSGGGHGLHTLLYGSPGSGKCLHPEEKVIMYDGSLKMAKDIKVGDKLMGDDSTPRNVLSTTTGEDDMYRIMPIKGESYVVNAPHILSLRCGYNATVSDDKQCRRYRVKWMDDGKATSKSFTYTNRDKEETLAEAREFAATIESRGKIVDIPLNEYLQKPATWKKRYKGYRVGVEFPYKNVELDPYMIGYWLGDGTSSSSEITTNDPEIIQYFREHLYILNVEEHDIYRYYIGTGEGNKGRKENYFLQALQYYNLLNNKHIPDEYKYNSREMRLKILAGIIDSDGYYGGEGNNYYEITQKNKRLADDIVYLCRSLGFACYQSEAQKTCTNAPGGPKTGTYYRCFVSGEGLEEIPVILERKKAHERHQIKDALNFGFSVEPLGRGQYCGFELDGNRRFLLKDFTVTHNTKTGTMLSKIWYSLGYLNKSRDLSDPIVPLPDTSDEVSFQTLIAAFLIGYIVVTLLVDVLRLVYKYFGLYATIGLGVVIVIIIILIFAPKLFKSKPKSKTTIAQTRQMSDNPDKTRLDKLEDPLITIVSREDFVSGYLGQSALKTKKLLEKNVGKVLFIDEAYSLYNGDHDPYGAEVLDTINRFMSERAKDIVIIFAGYEHLMRKVLEAQPGLARRFMWHLSCDPYSAEQLYQIFKIQLNEEHQEFKIEDEKATEQLFKDNYDVFQNFAGDTKRLCFYCASEYSSKLLRDDSEGDGKLTMDILEKSVEQLKANNLRKAKGKEKVEQGVDLMDMITQANKLRSRSRVEA